MKIKFVDEELFGELERDILIAGAPESGGTTPKDTLVPFKQVDGEWTLVIPPSVKKKLGELGLKPEDLVRMLEKSEDDLKSGKALDSLG